MGIFKVIRTSKELSEQFRKKLIIENSRRYMFLLGLVILSQIVFIVLESFRILEWKNNVFILRVLVLIISSIIFGLIYFLTSRKDRKRSILILAVLTAFIQLITIFVGCYFVIYMFNDGIYSYSTFLLVSLIASLTCVRNPYYSGGIIVLFFVGLTLYLMIFVLPISNWTGELLIAVVFLISLHMGNILNYNRHIKLFLHEKEIKKINKRLKAISNTDELTGIYNRRKISEVINEYIALSKRYSSCFCIAMIDIDNFKMVNDNFGHNVGDSVLYELSNNIRFMLRSTDVFGRWGGEEFVILMPNCKEEDAYLLLERLRKNIENYEFAEAGKVTFSAGISTYEKDDLLNLIIERADIALYKAKESGRNTVIIYSK